MKNKYVFTAVLLAAILVASMGFTNIYVSHHQPAEEEDFVVVTSFYPMYIAAMNVIGDTEGVTLKNLSEPQTGCLHDFQLTPADMKLLSTADVFVMNGGGIESFMEDIAAQYPDLVIVEACEGIELLGDEHSHDGISGETYVHDEILDGAFHSEDAHGEIHDTGNVHVHETEEIHEHEEEGVHNHETEDTHNHDGNAHAWMSVELYRQQIENIADGLAEADPVHSENYFANAGIYDGKLEALQAEQEKVQVLAEGQPAVMFHCAYEYVAVEMGLETVFCMDLDEERQVSAGEVAQVLEIIEHDDVKYIFAEELYGKSMCEMVQKEVDVTVIYLNPLSRGEYDADSYIEGMRENLELIREAMK